MSTVPNAIRTAFLEPLDTFLPELLRFIYFGHATKCTKDEPDITVQWLCNTSHAASFRRSWIIVETGCDEVFNMFWVPLIHLLLQMCLYLSPWTWYQILSKHSNSARELLNGTSSNNAVTIKSILPFDTKIVTRSVCLSLHQSTPVYTKPVQPTT